MLYWGTICTREVASSKKGGFSLVGASYTCFRQIHFTLEFSSWELERFTRLIIFERHLDVFHVERLQQALGHFCQYLGQNPKLPPRGSLGVSRVRALNLWVPQVAWLSWILWLVNFVLWKFKDYIHMAGNVRMVHLYNRWLQSVWVEWLL